MITSRLRTEYGVEIAVDPSTFTAARWVADPAKPMPLLGGATTAAVDRQGRRVLLFANEWEVQYFEKQNPTFGLLAESPVGVDRHSSAVISQISAGSRPQT